MNKKALRRMELIARFLTWWRNEMTALIPIWVSLTFWGGTTAKELKFTDNVSTPTISNGAVLVPSSLLQPEEPIVPTSKRRETVDVWLPERFLLRRSVSIPKQARKNARTLATLDLKRNTPLRDGEAAWSLGQIQNQGQTLVAEQLVAKTSDIALIKRRLGALGLTPRRFLAKGSNNTTVVLQDLATTVNSSGRRWRRVNGALIGIALALALALWLRPAWEAQLSLAALEQEITTLREEALGLRRELASRETSRSEAERIRASLLHRPRLIETLREATVALPDTAWISAMTFTPNAVSITGEASEAAAQIVFQLSNSPQFENPRLSGPTTRSSSGSERFEVSATLEVLQ